LALPTERDKFPMLDFEQARRTAENYSKSCGVPCRVINAAGETLFATDPGFGQLSICEMVGRLLPSTANATTHPATALAKIKAGASASVCNNAHLYGCFQAERFGGQYVYFCPIGLTHWASPILNQDQVVGALIGGPVHLTEPDELLIDDLTDKLAIHPSFVPELQKQMKAVQVLSTDRVNSLSELLYLAAHAISDRSFERLEQNRKAGDFQAELWEQINFLKNYAYVDPEHLDYPIVKEDQLLEAIENGDKAESQRILNEILGYIFFSSSGSIEVMRARVIELVVLLSRAAIRGGGDVEQIFGLNYTYLGKIYSFRNIDEIAFWLSGIMARFTDQVFSLSNVKHADVIYRAVDYVKKNYMKRITLEETAEIVFLSPAYFSRIFKEEMGANFNSHVNQVRVEAAKKMLLNDAVSLMDISTLVGFEGQSYFSKVFKKMTGVTPGKYRESRGRVRPTA
jgi:two-component system response regulator YesN